MYPSHRTAYRPDDQASELGTDPAQPASSDEHGSADSRRILGSLLAQLDEDKREVVVLYELEGFTMKEIAEMLGCPLQTAYSRLHAGRERLAAAAAKIDSEVA